MDVTWPEELPFQVALGYKPNAEIAEDFSLSEDEFARIYGMEVFRKQVLEYKLRITEEGVGTKLLAQVASGRVIEKMMKLANDLDVSGGVRLDALKTVLHIAGIDTDNAEKSGDAFSAGGMLLQIMPPQVSVAQGPTDVEQLERAPDTIDTGFLEMGPETWAADSDEEGDDD